MSEAEMVVNARDHVERIREAMLMREQSLQSDLALVHLAQRDRARNLVHYWAFRECESEVPRHSLGSLGLDPLKDAEWDALNRVENVLHRLMAMTGQGGLLHHAEVEGHLSGRETLHRRTEELFGPGPGNRDTRIMVTLSAEGAEDSGIVEALARAGADCFRINCARDDREAWSRLIGQISRQRGDRRSPLVFMDLGGSKLRVTSCVGGSRSIRLKAGDTLFISKASIPSVAPSPNERDSTHFEIAVNDPSALAGVLPGHRVWFDDGKIGGIVRERREDAIRVEITVCREGGRKLRLERGVNLPDTMLRLPALTGKDQMDLQFAARRADFVALSFIRTASDVEEFRIALEGIRDARPAMVIKIETKEALKHLPELMLAGMRYDRVAMLLARGDLAVECGIQEMPRIQKRVVQFCAAASLPLFWATGVLERACRTGVPTRAEITDAVEASRAQCVMLNKGTYSIQALKVLGELFTNTNEER